MNRLALLVVFAVAATLPPEPRVTRSGSALPARVSADWWGAVQQEIAHSEYDITPRRGAAPVDHAAGYQASNRAQNFRTYFTDEGIRVIQRTAHKGPEWEWGLSLAGWGRESAPAHPVAAPHVVVEGNRIEYQRGDITEWYVNSARGLEQGFTIARRPVADRGSHTSAGRGPLRVELAVHGNLEAALANDGQAVDFRAAGAEAVRFDHLYVVDARQQVLDAWFEHSGDVSGAERLAIVVDDARATYPITIDPLATNPAWTVESDQADAFLSASVAHAGDVNGDGYSDVVVGAFFFDNGESNEGRAYVYHGSASGLSLTPNWTTEGNQINAWFGISVATAGDVNGDGYDDVIVGANHFTNGVGQEQEGRAFVYHGSAGGLSLTPNWTAESNQEAAGYGYTVASAGDVNGDGFSDVIVAAPFFDNGSIEEGRAYVYHGSGAGLGLAPAWTAESNQTLAFFASSVATAGDVNDDGFSDVIVGAYQFDAGSTDEGRAFVYHGSSTGLSLAANWTAESDQALSYFGMSVATAGDVNGDGYSDVIVGIPNFDNGQDNEGRAAVYHGSAGGLSLSANWTAESDQGTAYLGTSVATAGDVNGDGFSDVIVGANLFDNGQSDEGRAFMYTGSGTGLILAPAWTAESNQDGAEFAYSVATAGDVNGDGFSDVIVGARLFDNGQPDEGRAYVYHGALDPVSVATRVPARFELLGTGPNPGRGRCGVMLSMASPSRVHAEVLDVGGRMVAILAKNEAYEAGSHVLMWDGRDRSGAEAPAGVYLVRVRAAGQVGARKAVLARE